MWKKEQRSSHRPNSLKLHLRSSAGNQSPQPSIPVACVGICAPGPLLHQRMASLSQKSTTQGGGCAVCGFKGKEREWGGELRGNSFLLFFLFKCVVEQSQADVQQVLTANCCSRWHGVCSYGSGVCSAWLRHVPSRMLKTLSTPKVQNQSQVKRAT